MKVYNSSLLSSIEFIRIVLELEIDSWMLACLFRTDKITWNGKCLIIQILATAFNFVCSSIYCEAIKLIFSFFPILKDKNRWPVFKEILIEVEGIWFQSKILAVVFSTAFDFKISFLFAIRSLI